MRSKFIVVLVATLCSLTFAAAVVAIAGDHSTLKPFPPNPDAGKSDAERQAAVDAGDQAEVEYVRDFVAAATDPRTLPKIAIETFGYIGYSNPDEAIAGADVIVRGHVDSVGFSRSFRQFGSATITLAVDENLKGDPGGKKIVVRQDGGPVRQEKGGALAYLAGNPILLPGDDVLILAKGSPDKGYSPLTRVGIYFVRDGRVYTPDGHPCAAVINGAQVSDVLQFIRTSVSKIGLGPISKTPSCGEPATTKTDVVSSATGVR